MILKVKYKLNMFIFNRQVGEEGYIEINNKNGEIMVKELTYSFRCFRSYKQFLEYFEILEWDCNVN